MTSDVFTAHGTRLFSTGRTNTRPRGPLPRPRCTQFVYRLQKGDSCGVSHETLCTRDGLHQGTVYASQHCLPWGSIYQVKVCARDSRHCRGRQHVPGTGPGTVCITPGDTTPGGSMYQHACQPHFSLIQAHRCFWFENPLKHPSTLRALT